MSTDLRALSVILQGQQPRPKKALALALAIGAEVLLIGAVVWESEQRQPPPPAALPPMQLQLIQPETPKPTPPTPKPVPRPTPRPAPQTAPVKEVLPPSPLPSPVQAPPAPVVPPAPPPPAPVNPAVKADYLAQVKGAIQAAVHFPDAARMLGQGGRVQVAFTLQNGQISGLRILQKGSMEAFDSAALAAVRSAQLPPVPAELRGKVYQLELWVEFVLHDND
ncbi:MAG: TonB family protein [Acidithiobacillus sp.]|nr:TonB family protein [Acidithiobacillus sp.]